MALLLNSESYCLCKYIIRNNREEEEKKEDMRKVMIQIENHIVLLFTCNFTFLPPSYCTYRSSGFRDILLLHLVSLKLAELAVSFKHPQHSLTLIRLHTTYACTLSWSLHQRKSQQKSIHDVFSHCYQLQKLFHNLHALRLLSRSRSASLMYSLESIVLDGSR